MPRKNIRSNPLYSSADLLTWEKTKLLSAPWALPSFRREETQDFHQKVSAALTVSSPAKLFDNLAAIWDIDRRQVCVVERKIVSRAKRKVPMNVLRYPYNEDVNAMLSDIGPARFDGLRKCWLLEANAESDQLMHDLFSNFFSVVVDVTTMSILVNNAAPKCGGKTEALFLPAPFHIHIQISELILAIEHARGFDESPRSLAIHDGKRFVPFPELGQVWTQMPFLLCRYSVEEGRPRYLSFSTLAKSVEDIGYGNNDKRTRQAIARFIQSCSALQTPAFQTTLDSPALRDDNLVQEYLGPFTRFSSALQRAHKLFPDMNVAPLCSDYLTLVNRGHGADVDDDVVAYVGGPVGFDNYQSRLAQFFGYSADAYPIVFNRNWLENLDTEQAHEFSVTIAHELAHWLVMVHSNATNQNLAADGEHGVWWSAFYSVLAHTLLGPSESTRNDLHAHASDGVPVAAFETALSELAVPAITELLDIEGVLYTTNVVDIASRIVAAGTQLQAPSSPAK